MTSTETDRLAGVTASLSSKAPARVATTANITLSGTQTIDGISVVADDRVLVKDQTTASENGVYDCKSGAWVRSPDFDGTRDVVSGTFVVVAEGTSNAGTSWRISTTGDIAIGTTSIAFASMTIGSGISLPLAVSDGGTGSTTAGDARTALGLVIGTDVLANLSEDTTPQLGGDLDANGNMIKWAKGADVASVAALPILTDGNYFDVTGTTTITSINSAGGDGTIAPVIKLHFDNALTLTHHATDLILPSGANITTAAGDEAEFVEHTTGKWRCTAYTRATGEAVITSVDEQIFLSSGTWTKPAFGSFAVVECWGAGGSGGSRSDDNEVGGGGGGGYVRAVIAIGSLGATETVTIGAGGAAVTGNNNGNTGGNTTFGSHLTGYGGGAGSSGASGAAGGGGGGAAGAGGDASGTTGGTAGSAMGVAGSNNAAGQPADSLNGGGGAENAAAGGHAALGGGGGGGAGSGGGTAGGTSAFGGNGGAGARGSAGTAGTQPGGGGGGHSNSGDSSGAGGAGMCRVIVI